MVRHVAGTVFAAGLIIAANSISGLARIDPGECPRDSKLLGNVEISAVDSPDTWWGITKAGLADAGYDTTAELLAFMNGLFGTSHNTLAPLIELLLEPVRDFDVNGNGFICAFSLRGTRAWIGDPNYTFYTFGTTDDKVR